jgi:hypothetical protein
VLACLAKVGVCPKEPVDLTDLLLQSDECVVRPAACD